MQTPSTPNPFKFLDPYSRAEGNIFFGRDGEIEVLYSLVFESDLLLVYGESGTGKTSLIQCGLANRFEAGDWMEVFIRRRENLLDSLKEAINRRAKTKLSPRASLRKRVKSLFLDYFKPVYLIFDQFEEIFVLGSEEEQKRFFSEIQKLLSAGLNCTVVIIMREEYIARLYPFEKIIPNLFQKRFRVEHMTEETTKSVIKNSCDAFHISLESEEENLEQMLNNLKAGSATISLPYLQVYLHEFYKEDFLRTYGDKDLGNFQNFLNLENLPPLEFTTQEIAEFGEIGDVLKNFLQEQREEIQTDLERAFQAGEVHPRAVRKILGAFASLEGTRIPQVRTELSIPQVTDEQLEFVLQRLDQARILREEEGIYEIAHDTLALRIAEQRDADEIALLEIAALVRNRARSYERTQTFMDAKELELISNYENQLKEENSLKKEAWNFVENSRKDARRKRSSRNLLITGAVSVLAALAIFAGLKWQEANERLRDVLYTKLADFDELMYQLELEQAEETLKEGLDLGVGSDSVISRYAELIFLYTEAGDTTKTKAWKLYEEIRPTLGQKPSGSISEDTLSFLTDQIRQWLDPTQYESLTSKYYPTMLPIEGGTFMMGSDESDTLAEYGEKPQHEVKLSSFEMGRTEVTILQYQLYALASGKEMPRISLSLRLGNQPMISVSWYDAARYCNWLSFREGLDSVYTIKREEQFFKKDLGNIDTVDINYEANGYRLPTEAEWEYAARGGIQAKPTMYAGSDSIDEVGWYFNNSENHTHVVAQKLPNELGLYDMSGNVFEWCQDWYGGYPDSLQIDPLGSSKGVSRVLRGGSLFYNQIYCRSAYRFNITPAYRDFFIGFRLVRVP